MNKEGGVLDNNFCTIIMRNFRKSLTVRKLIKSNGKY